MRDYSFLGPIAQFWELICAEQNCQETLLGREPFKLESLGRNTRPCAKYVPAPGEVLCLTFFNADYTDNVLVVEAENGTVEDILDIKLFPQGSAFEEKNKSGYAMWNGIARVLVTSGLLIDHRAFIITASHKTILPPEPPPGSDSSIWLDWRLDMIKAGQKCTLKQLASKIPISYSHLRRIHVFYKISYELPNHYESRYKNNTKNSVL